MKRRTFLAASMLGAAGLGAAALARPAWAQSKGTVGIAMPTKSSARWIADGDNISKVLTQRGYAVNM